MDIETESVLRPTGDQIYGRLPELESLDGQLRVETKQVFVECVPPYFWLTRASEEYHPPDERGLCGLWLHSKRVYTVYRMIEDSFRAMSLLDDFEANCARAAVLLHDAFKYGQAPDNNDEDYHAYADGKLSHLPEYTQPEHDVEMAEFVREKTSLPDLVADIIEPHGGSPSWFGHEGPSPETAAQMAVHTADMVATNEHHRVPVWNPDSAIVEATDGVLPTIDDSQWVLDE